jgi:hypothetical protein
MNGMHRNEVGPRRLFGKLYYWTRVNGVLVLRRWNAS